MDDPVERPYQPGPVAGPVCPRHPDRVSHLSCRRCGRPACPECQEPAIEGFDCIDCADDIRLGRTATWSNDAAHSVEGPGHVEVERAQPQPVVSYLLAGLCAVVYGAQWLMPGLIDLGDFSPVSGYAEPWRFLTSAFLHSPQTITHILFNMMALLSIGKFCEPLLGKARFSALYLLSALGGSVGYLLSAPALDLSDQRALQSWVGAMVGASGAVFGLFAAALLVMRRIGMPVTGMLVLIAVNLALPFFYPGIAWQAHLGGAFVGLVVTALILATAHPGRSRLLWPGLLTVLALLVGAAVTKYQLNADALDVVLAHRAAGV